MTNIQGTAPAGGYAPITAPAVRDDVAQRADRVEALINSDGVFSYATASEVRQAADVIFGGDARTADGVIDELARRGTLDDFAAEVMDGNVVGGGLSVTDRQRLMANFARNLDGDSLAKVSDAFAATHARSGGHQSVAELGQAIGTHATPGAKLDYLTAQAPKTTDKPSHTDAGFGSATTRWSDAEALAAAHVVGSLKTNPAAAETAFRTLADTPGATDAVIEASTQLVSLSFVAGPGGATQSHLSDPSVYTDVMASAAAIRSDAAYPTSRASAAALKADVVASGIRVRSDRDGLPGLSSAQDVVLRGVQAVIDSDVDGVVGHMANNQDYQVGTVLARYAKGQIEAGREDVLGRQFVAAQLGDAHAERGAVDARFGRSVEVGGPNGGPVFPHAVTGGYFMGAMHAASLAVHADQTARAETATKFAEAGIDAAATFAPDRGAALSSLAANGAKMAVGHGLKKLIVTTDPIANRAFYYGGIPRDADGNQAVSSPAVSDYHRRFDEVSRFAKP